MALSIRIKGLDASGVELLSPARPEFDELARPLLGERIADVGLTLKPMLVIVSNDSIQTVVSLSLDWRVTQLLRRPVRRGKSPATSLVFSDCAYVVFDRPKDAERFAVHAIAVVPPERHALNAWDSRTVRSPTTNS
jgi:hypothetical protein